MSTLEESVDDAKKDEGVMTLLAENDDASSSQSQSWQSKYETLERKHTALTLQMKTLEAQLDHSEKKAKKAKQKSDKHKALAKHYQQQLIERQQQQEQLTTCTCGITHEKDTNATANHISNNEEQTHIRMHPSEEDDEEDDILMKPPPHEQEQIIMKEINSHPPEDSFEKETNHDKDTTNPKNTTSVKQRQPKQDKSTRGLPPNHETDNDKAAVTVPNAATRHDGATTTVVGVVPKTKPTKPMAVSSVQGGGVPPPNHMNHTGHHNTSLQGIPPSPSHLPPPPPTWTTPPPPPPPPTVVPLIPVIQHHVVVPLADEPLSATPQYPVPNDDDKRTAPQVAPVNDDSTISVFQPDQGGEERNKTIYHHHHNNHNMEPDRVMKMGQGQLINQSLESRMAARGSEPSRRSRSNSPSSRSHHHHSLEQSQSVSWFQGLSAEVEATNINTMPHEHRSQSSFPSVSQQSQHVVQQQQQQQQQFGSNYSPSSTLPVPRKSAAVLGPPQPTTHPNHHNAPLESLTTQSNLDVVAEHPSTTSSKPIMTPIIASSQPTKKVPRVKRNHTNRPPAAGVDDFPHPIQRNNNNNNRPSLAPTSRQASQQQRPQQAQMREEEGMSDREGVLGTLDKWLSTPVGVASSSQPKRKITSNSSTATVPSSSCPALTPSSDNNMTKQSPTTTSSSWSLFGSFRDEVEAAAPQQRSSFRSRSDHVVARSKKDSPVGGENDNRRASHPASRRSSDGGGGGGGAGTTQWVTL